MNYDWIAFFSQTGSEIYNIISQTKKFPVAVITNRQDDEGLNLLLKQMRDEGKFLWIVLSKNPEEKEYKKVLKPYKNPLITLHGYLRIIPKSICKKYKIYNLHPGLITHYPELRGKDPQIRAIKAGHKIAGAVIHKVIPEVDEGEVISSHAVNIQYLSETEIFDKLRALGSILWYNFFNSYEHR